MMVQFYGRALCRCSKHRSCRACKEGAVTEDSSMQGSTVPMVCEGQGMHVLAYSPGGFCLQTESSGGRRN